MRKTKIVATLGPATDEPGILRKLLAVGLDVARFNFSHGTYEEKINRAKILRESCQELGATVALLGDTRGPEIRLGSFEGGRAELLTGGVFTLTTDTVMGDDSKASVTYKDLPGEVNPGDRILLDDGLVELTVESVSSGEILTRIVNGGAVSDRKGVNVPGVKLSLPFISEKDREDLRFIVENGFDFVAASFARTARDILEIREELRRLDGNNKIRIIAKIENAEGVKNADEILEVSEGLMVARGDLGVEVPYEELPILQKELIKKAVRQGKEVITATQMLESMIKNPRPTRAETSDVANAIYDGTGAIMLSGETAMGKYPVEALTTMAKTASRIEADIDYRTRFQKRAYRPGPSVTNAIAHATVMTAHNLGAVAILTVSLSGATARNVAKFRPLCPILACTPDPVVHRQLKMEWGVTPLLTRKGDDASTLFSHAVTAALEQGYIKKGDIIVLTAGVPAGRPGTTNMIKVHEVGDDVLDRPIVL